MTPPLKPILLVEDDQNDLELALMAFEKAQLKNKVIALRDGAELLQYLRSEAGWQDREKGFPAVVLLDIKLPKLNGLEILELIKHDEKLRKIPVVILSSSRESSDLERSYELGVNAYVVKPVKFSEFLRAVQDLGEFWGVLNELPPESFLPPTET